MDLENTRQPFVCTNFVQNRLQPAAPLQGIESMGLATIQSRALLGLTAPTVCVEVHLANGLPSFTLVGLADTEVKEARERVRSALHHSGLDYPSNQRITVNLAPADLPKDSGRFDLPMALGLLAASGSLDAIRLARHVFAGELSLGGELRPIRGALALSLALQAEAEQTAHPPPTLVLPPGSAEEAALVPNTRVVRARHLLDVVRAMAPEGSPLNADTPPDPDGWTVLTPLAPHAATPGPDLADVVGQAGARRALEIAAAGGHSLLLSGPPGAGKSMLAQRFAGLLPPMSVLESLESAAIASLVGRFDRDRLGQRLTVAPHHSASAVALVGGGSPPKPGEISLAHHGVLFLDELPEFPRAALEALREPLETGMVRISRASQRAEFPARFQLIAAMNPCPCGYLGHPTIPCKDTPDQVARYQAKLSGPLLDRIDLHVDVPPLPPEELLGKFASFSSNESTSTVRKRVLLAQNLAAKRQGCPNHALSGDALQHHVQLDDAARAFAQKAATRLGWSGRATHRALRVARTIADLAGAHSVNTSHLAEAIQYRRGLSSTS